MAVNRSFEALDSTLRSAARTVRRSPALWPLPAALVLSLILFTGHILTADHTRYATGTVEATRADIASKIPARIRQFDVDEGSRVARGDTLLRFENREIAARVGQARAAMSAAQARYAIALNGARKEEVAMAEKTWKQACSAAEVAGKTYDRLKELHDEGVISHQQWDEADYRYRAAVDARDAAHEKYLMTMRGARPEEKEAARELYLQGVSALAEAESYLDETTLRAPIGGIVEKRIVNEGELVAAGYPLLTIVDPARWWVIVNVDERSAGNLHPGDSLRCLIPAKGSAPVTMRIARMSVMGDFATRKATNELNSFDTRSFEVKLVPLGACPGVARGMTVLVPVGAGR
ncbi:MAG TPA: efflux RND transporter periplasmic adaptor subunit [Bacteroidota bacterium]|nr:efflux RND transporter periplasmic adaptor subunit [Bacteroidota bacterium]